MAADLTVVIDADTKDFKKAVKEVRNESKKLGKQVKKDLTVTGGLGQSGSKLGAVAGVGRGLSTGLATAAALITGVGAAIVGLLTVTVRYRKEAQKLEDSQKQLAFQLRAMGNAAGFTLTELNGYARELRDVSRLSQEAISETQALFIGIGVGRRNLEAASTAAADLAATMGITLAAAAKQVAKEMQDTGDVAGQGAKILDKYREAMGGAAEASTKGLGVWTQLSKAMGELGTAISGLIGSALAPFGKMLLFLVRTARDMAELLRDVFFPLDDAAKNSKATAKNMRDMARSARDIGRIESLTSLFGRIQGAAGTRATAGIAVADNTPRRQLAETVRLRKVMQGLNFASRHGI